MTEEIWNRMSAAEQGNYWWAELDRMIRAALAEVNYVPGNSHTKVLSGLTTIVARNHTEP